METWRRRRSRLIKSHRSCHIFLTYRRLLSQRPCRQSLTDVQLERHHRFVTRTQTFQYHVSKPSRSTRLQILAFQSFHRHWLDCTAQDQLFRVHKRLSGKEVSGLLQMEVEGSRSGCSDSLYLHSRKPGFTLMLARKHWRRYSSLGSNSASHHWLLLL